MAAISSLDGIKDSPHWLVQKVKRIPTYSVFANLILAGECRIGYDSLVPNQSIPKKPLCLLILGAVLCAAMLVASYSFYNEGQILLSVLLGVLGCVSGFYAFVGIIFVVIMTNDLGIGDKE